MWARKAGPLDSGGETPAAEATAGAWGAWRQGRRYLLDCLTLWRDTRELSAEAPLDLMPVGCQNLIRI